MHKTIPKGINRFWAFNVLQDGTDTTELLLYSDIADEQSYDWWSGNKGEEVTPKAFRSELKEVSTNNLCVRINSRGGSVFAASSIATQIKDMRESGKKVTCKIDGICASAAVLIALSCENIAIAESAYMMIHDPLQFVFDYLNASQLREMADTLDTIKAGIIAGYVSRTGLSEKECSKLMSAETWLTASEAVEKGFADEIMFAEKDDVENRIRNAFVNCLDSDKLNSVPTTLKNVLENKKSNEGVKHMDFKNYAELKAAFPAIVDEAEQSLRNEAVKNATTAERDRMKAIDALAGKIEPEMLDEAKYGENPMTADEVIVAAFKADKMISANGGYMNAAKEDAEDGAGVKGEADDGKDDGKKEEEATIENIVNAAKEIVSARARK